MYTLTCESSFDTAHFLTNYNGKCANIHGHRWRVILAINGDLDNGMVVDFNIIKKDLKEMCDKFDHTFIVEKNSLDDNLFILLNDKFKLTVVPAFTSIIFPSAEIHKSIAVGLYAEVRSRLN